MIEPIPSLITPPFGRRNLIKGLAGAAVAVGGRIRPRCLHRSQYDHHRQR